MSAEQQYREQGFSYRVMDRYETCQYFQQRAGQRRVVSRYNDGEWNLMTGGTKGRHVSESANRIGKDAVKRIGSLLNEAITKKGQDVGVNVLKPHNRPNGSWERCQQYLAKTGGHKQYIAANWLVHDFKTACQLVPQFFIGKVLIISGYAEAFNNLLCDVRASCDTYQPPTRGASAEYDKHHAEVIKLISDGSYDNVLFGCGPLGKVLLADAIKLCASNLIDIGALACVIPKKIEGWPTGWVKTIDIKKARARFFERVKEENYG